MRTIPRSRRIPVTSAQGKGIRVERYTADCALQLATAVPASTQFYNVTDNENADPTAATYQSSKNAIRQAEVQNYNYICIQRVCVRLRFAVALVDQRDIELLGNMKIQINRQSEDRGLEFFVNQAWSHTEAFQSNNTNAAVVATAFHPQGYGYDVTDSGRYLEQLEINSPTIGDAIGALDFPGLWIPSGPLNVFLLQQQAQATLQATRVMQMQLKGYRVITNAA